MTNAEVRTLHSGDEVAWADPDNGICSRSMVIDSIALHEDAVDAADEDEPLIVIIIDREGNELHCMANELS